MILLGGNFGDPFVCSSACEDYERPSCNVKLKSLERPLLLSKT
jgi:hypothetical protein